MRLSTGRTNRKKAEYSFIPLPLRDCVHSTKLNIFTPYYYTVVVLSERFYLNSVVVVNILAKQLIK